MYLHVKYTIFYILYIYIYIYMLLKHIVFLIVLYIFLLFTCEVQLHKMVANNIIICNKILELFVTS